MFSKSLVRMINLNYVCLLNKYCYGSGNSFRSFSVNPFWYNISEKLKNNRYIMTRACNKQQIVMPEPNFENFKDSSKGRIGVTIMGLSGIFSFFQTKEDEQESELITIIKRSVLMIQKDDFVGAEQMLHLALRLAQEQQNADGVTYVYDLLANVAFTQGNFEKAENLFIEVMKRVLTTGITQDDPKIIHMSLKLAKIYEHKKDYMKAEEGYKFCINSLEKQVSNSDEEDILLLWAMTLDWYARFLHERNRLDEAFNNYKKAYEMCLQLNGEIHEQTVILLNDLGTISFLRGDNDNAIMYMTKAVETGKHLPNMEDFSSVYVNLGNIYMQKNMYSEATKSCKEGWQNAKRHKNEEGIKEANICLEELRNLEQAAGACYPVAGLEGASKARLQPRLQVPEKAKK